MGIVYTEIMLKNAGDVENVQRGYITEDKVRAVTVRAMVDTGSGTLVINEEIRQALGLTIMGLRRAELASGTKQVYQVTMPVEINWQGRKTALPSLVVPDAGEVLLGAIPLEDLDLMVDPVRQTLVGAHGDEVLCMLK